MAEAHDTWLQGLGIDIDKLRAGIGDAVPTGANPSADPGLAPALVDTGVAFGKGFVKGAGDTASGIANSPAGQFVGGMAGSAAAPLTLAARALDAAVTGDASRLAPPGPGINLNIDPNDPREQAKARATVQSTTELGVALLGKDDPLALAKAAPAVADVLVNGDPEKVGEGSGKVAVVVGVGAAVGGLAGLGEAGVAEAGSAEAGTVEAGAAKPPISPLAGEVPPPQSFGQVPTQQVPGISPLAGEVPADRKSVV